MKSKKFHKKELAPKQKDVIGDQMHKAKVNNEKVKYKHKNHWLEDEEDDVPVKSTTKKKKK